MSNTSVGNIYHQIINEVIEASRVDFEDQGVGEEVLEELRKVCSFFPPSLPSLRTSHTQTHMHKAQSRRPSFHLICSYESAAFFHLTRAPYIPCIEVDVGLDCTGLAFSLARRCWLAGGLGCLCCLFAAALQAVAGGADCGSESEEGRAPGSQI